MFRIFSGLFQGFHQTGFVFVCFSTFLLFLNTCSSFVFSDRDFFEDLRGQGLPLGVSEDAVYEESVKHISPGQVILVGTDGIKETCNAKGEMFGENRLKKILRGHAQKTAKDVIAAVIDALEHFRFPLKRQDDITLVVIKIL